MTQTTRAVDLVTAERRSLRGAVDLVAASAVALVVWAVSVPIAGVALTLGSGPKAQTVGPASVALVPLLAGGAGWALLAFLRARVRGGVRAWRITAWVVLALSLLGPVSAGASGAVLVSLVTMHVTVGITIIVGLAPASADRSPAR